jgi:hypothetical protein
MARIESKTGSTHVLRARALTTSRTHWRNRRRVRRRASGRSVYNYFRDYDAANNCSYVASGHMQGYPIPFEDPTDAARPAEMLREHRTIRLWRVGIAGTCAGDLLHQVADDVEH